MATGQRPAGRFATANSGSVCATSGNPEIALAFQDDPSGTTPDNGEIVFFEYNGTGADNDLANYTRYGSDTTGLVAPEFTSDFDGGSTAGILDMDGDGLPELVMGSAGAGATDPIVIVYEFTSAFTLSVNDWTMY